MTERCSDELSDAMLGGGVGADVGVRDGMSLQTT
jgi:hypothetical protein